MAIKMGAAADVMFVLCVHTPGTAILEVVNSLKQNVRTEYVSSTLNLRSSDLFSEKICFCIASFSYWKGGSVKLY